jgi:shikimate dehydrogenase
LLSAERAEPSRRLILTGVLGFPVGHSRSPAMHNAAFRELGIDWRYMKLPVPQECFDETARALPGSGYRGANVTVPYKLAALALADEATDAARAIGAANTLTFTEGDGEGDGAIAADNTDAGGLLDALGSPPSGVRALVLGAGGAGRAAVWALREAGAAEVSVWNRTPERAAALAAELGVRHAEGVMPSDLLVNATTVGLDPALDRGAALESLGLTGLDPPATVVDLVYGEQVTPVVAWAQRAGSRVVEGLEVLVRQGARSLESWTGREAPLETMRAAARAGG